MIRKIDDLGRIVIPKEWRKDMNLGLQDDVQMEYDDKAKSVLIRKYTIDGECCFCGNKIPAQLLEFKGKRICVDCRSQLIEE